MKGLAYYESLPDSMTAEQLHGEFTEVLQGDPRSEADLMSEALFALSERQWNTYELADEPLRKDIAAMTLKLWSDHDADRAETLLGVTSRLGLGAVMAQLRQTDRSRYAAGVRKAVEEAIEEFGDTVDDPYSGIER